MQDNEHAVVKVGSFCASFDMKKTWLTSFFSFAISMGNLNIVWCILVQDQCETSVGGQIRLICHSLNWQTQKMDVIVDNAKQKNS